MPIDKREDILVRIEAILTALVANTDIKVWRDRAELDDSETSEGSGVYKEIPAYVLLDGSEAKLTGSTDRRGPQLMLLQPQIFYIPVPSANQLNVGIGPQLSAHRIMLIKAIMQDGALADLLGSNGYIEYRGMESDMQTGAEVKGQFKLDFALAYVFNFSKL